jgi:hypothetical protein
MVADSGPLSMHIDGAAGFFRGLKPVGGRHRGQARAAGFASSQPVIRLRPNLVISWFPLYFQGG